VCQPAQRALATLPWRERTQHRARGVRRRLVRAGLAARNKSQRHAFGKRGKL
jgi:hypothetical protein